MNKKVIGVIIVIVVALVLLIALEMNKPLKDNEVKILTPANGEELEIGDNYTITWAGESNENLVTLVEKTYTSDTDFSYGDIAKDIPFSLKKFTWNVPLLRQGYKYKIAIITENRTEITASEGFFVPVDNNIKIVGSEEVVIDSNHLLSFNEPFNISVSPLQNTNVSYIYSSGDAVQKDFAQVTAKRFYLNACDEGAFYPQDAVAPKCEVEGEQAIVIELLAVHGSQGLYYTSKGNIYLSSVTHKVWNKREGYEVELLSLDAQKKEARIIVREK